MEISEWIADRTAKFEIALDVLVPRADEIPEQLHQAMRHSLFAGGKRLRPLLCIAAAECIAEINQNKPQIFPQNPSYENIPQAFGLAAAVEILHTYTLIHDDLPSMDDDDLRRGQPTCHVVFGEAVAILAGDALQALAFELAAKKNPNSENPIIYDGGAMVLELARAASSREVVGGQILDLHHEGDQNTNLEQLTTIHNKKTAAMLVAALKLGAMSAGASQNQLDLLRDFGKNLGLAFQVIDDILDETASTEQLGKTAGKDAAVAKATFPKLIGLEKSSNYADELTKKSLESLSALVSQKNIASDKNQKNSDFEIPTECRILAALAQKMLKRKS